MVIFSYIVATQNHNVFNNSYHALSLCFIHSTPLLNFLHWLPVRCRTMCKICTSSYQTLSCKLPLYFHYLLTLVSKPVQLQSSSSDLLCVLKVSTNIGTRAFAVVTTLWNMLPCNVKSVKRIARFEHSLTTLPIHHSFLAYQSI